MAANRLPHLMGVTMASEAYADLGGIVDGPSDYELYTAAQAILRDAQLARDYLMPGARTHDRDKGLRAFGRIRARLIGGDA